MEDGALKVVVQLLRWSKGDGEWWSEGEAIEVIPYYFVVGRDQLVDAVDVRIRGALRESDS